MRSESDPSRFAPVMGKLAGILRLDGQTVGKRLGFLIVFVGAKVVALAGMLWLARVAAPELFGGVELALSIGLIVAGVGLLGVPGGVTRLALELGEAKIGDHLTFAALCIAAPTAFAALVGLALGGPPIVALGLANCAIAAFQAFASTYARIRARPVLNSIFDPLPVLSALLLASVLWWAGQLTLQTMAVGTALLAATLTVLLVAGFLKTRRPKFSASYHHALSVSLPILVFSGVAMMVGAGLRPLLGIRFSLDTLAIYSLCFRLCAPSMLMHQTVATAFFARIYKAPDKMFDLIAAALISACTIGVAAVWLGLPVIVPLAFPQYLQAMPDLFVVFPLVGLQVVYWIQIALLEMKVGRHGVAAVAAVAGYVIFAIFAVGFLTLPIGSLVRATALFDLALAGFAIAQYVVLRRRNVHLPLIAASAPLAGAICGLMVFLAP